MKLALVIVALALGLPAPAPALAQDVVTIRFGAAPVPRSPFNLRGVAPFIQQVQDDAQGTIKINVFPGATLGPPTQTYDNTLKGVYDISFGMLGVVSSQFPKTHVTTLPFINRSSHEASVALWRLYEKGVIASEYASVHPLAIYDFADTRIHSKTPVRRMEDMQGLKITATSRAVVRAVGALGGSILTISPPEVYQALQRGTAEAAALAWTAVMPFKIFEVTSFHTEASLGMEPAYLLMNKDRYAKLPAPARAAFDRHAGLKLSERLGRLNDAIAAEDRAKVEAMPGREIVALSPAEAQRWRKRLAPITDEWLKATPDGPKVLAAYKAELAKLRAAKD